VSEDRSARTDASSARAIENVIARYAELVDAGDFTALGAMFDDASFGGEGGAVHGSEAVERVFRSMVRVHEDGTPRTKHVTTNVQIELAPDGVTATARSYVTVFQALADLPLQPIVAGRYRDRFACVHGTWRFVERRFTTDLVGDVSRHLRGGEATLRS
jgi:3-phenylpropionate/cinnamic acid dioxygenase small subunit